MKTSKEWNKNRDIYGLISPDIGALSSDTKCYRLGSWVDKMDGRWIDLIDRDGDRVGRWWRWPTYCPSKSNLSWKKRKNNEFMNNENKSRNWNKQIEIEWDGLMDWWLMIDDGIGEGVEDDWLSQSVGLIDSLNLWSSRLLNLSMNLWTTNQ